MAEAITAASDGDTIRLIEDTPSAGQAIVAINKSLTIDTNGFTWYGGSNSGTYKKTVTANLTNGASVVITNSTQTGEISNTGTPSISTYGGNLQGGINVASGCSLKLVNVYINNTNNAGNNMSACVALTGASTLDI